MIKQIDCIEGQPIMYDDVRQIMTFKGRLRVDTDGVGPSHGDRWHLGDTSLHRNGQPLNADFDQFIVIPMRVPREVPPIVMGSQAYVIYRGLRVPAVVGDKGPNDRLGEGSRALEIALGINADPNSGGVDNPDVLFEIHLGVPAVVNGVQYQLQSS